MNLPNFIEVPPGCFHYVVPETGIRIPQNGNTSFPACVSAVQEHYRINGYTVPSNLRQTIEDYCCSKQQPGHCRGDDRPIGIEKPATQQPTLDQLRTGSQAVLSWLTKGKVDEQTASLRALACRSCPLNQPLPEHCPSCKRGVLDWLKQAAVGALGPGKDWEEGLKTCVICGCLLRLKVWTRIDVILKGMTKQQLEALDGGCWIRKEQEINE